MTKISELVTATYTSGDFIPIIRPAANSSWVHRKSPAFGAGSVIVLNRQGGSPTIWGGNGASGTNDYDISPAPIIKMGQFVQTVVDGTNTGPSVAVVYPGGGFTARPLIFISKQFAADPDTWFNYEIDQYNSDGFTIQWIRGDTTGNFACDFSWLAIGKVNA